jgi:hypothetical protein
MDKYQAASIVMSALALLVSGATAYFQYQTRQDAVAEEVKIELKLALGNSILNPTDARMLSGVDERRDMKAAVLVTNAGQTTVRILEVGYHDFDLPKLLFYAAAENAKVLSPGEQMLVPAGELVQITRQLTDDIKLGESKNAKIFAVSTKGNRFEVPPIITVAK